MDKALKRVMDMRRQVLVVDDELVNRQLLGFIISRDYDVLYAGDGQEALEIIREKSELLSLVLLDLMMPVMDGFELLEVLHGDEALQKIPVIVLTSERDAEVRSLQLGAVDFITKPYDMPDVILARVRRSIELSENTQTIQAVETDDLTKLLTREFFFEYGKQMELHHPDWEMDAVLIDLNRFHLVHDMYGRAFVDRILCRIADTIRFFLKENEGIASHSEGNLFYLYVEHREDYAPLLDQIYEGLEELQSQSRIRVHMGICPRTERSVDIEQLFDRARVACDTLRDKFMAEIAWYDQELHEKRTLQEHLIDGVDEAIEQKQFKVYYQPKYDITQDTPRLCSAEALVRWVHPELGMVSPGVFIPLFEENGLIQKLDRYVWREVAAQIREWKEKYGEAVPVSVNVSRIDIYDPNLENEFLELTRENDLTPREYLLEITESAYTEDSDQLIRVVGSLRDKGFRIEMDDFGAGYSSLNMLSVLPIDALKLDMSFVRNISREDIKGIRLIQLITDIARFLSVPVVAEGVEREDQYRLLKEIGCDIIQGYYFSRPVPADEFEKFLMS